MEPTKVVVVQCEQMCPHCSGKFMTSIRMTSPVIYWSLKYEDLEKIKKKVKDEVSKVKFIHPEQRKQTMEWLEKSDVLIGPEEADVIIEQIKADNKVEEPKKETK